MTMQLLTRTAHRLLDHLVSTGRLSAQPTLPAHLDLAELSKALELPRPELLRAIADLEHMPFVDLREVSPSLSAIEAVPEALVHRFGCLPLFLNRRELTIAIGDPQQPNRLDRLRDALADYEVIFVLADEDEMLHLLQLYYTSEAEAAIAPYMAEVPLEQGMRLQQMSNAAPIVQMVQTILERAVYQKASDVHIEPLEGVSRVRFRLDGLMEEAFSFHGTLHEAIVSRLKVVAGVNTADRIRPQDGRFTMTIDGEPVEVRLSTLRLMDGEKAVMRLLRREGAGASLAELGMTAPVRASFERLLAQPYGMLLVCGPTGSGKTSTLYAALRHLNRPDVNLIALEDPVELRLPGINQVPMSPERGVTFAKALRAVLRQDPDVVMLGEMRDLETAEIAIRTALTGHLLLSTLHANDSTEALTRLVEMGLAPTNVAPALLGVMAQRLVRRLCECHLYEPAPASVLESLGFAYLGDEVPVPVAHGCPSCHMTGFKGRLAIFELLELDETMRRLIIEHAGSVALREAARRNGLRTLLEDGMRRVLDGSTTLNELLRVVNYAS